MGQTPTHLDWTPRINQVRNSIPQISTLVRDRNPDAARDALQNCADALPPGSQARGYAEQLARWLRTGAAISVHDVRLLHGLLEDLAAQILTPGHEDAAPTLTGLTLSVCRSVDTPDLTRDGVTARHTRLLLVGTLDETGTFAPSPPCARSHAPTAATPAVALRAGYRGTVHLVPVDTTGQPLGGRWHMAGGNFAATTDSRLGTYFDQIGRDPLYAAISVHDRTED